MSSTDDSIEDLAPEVADALRIQLIAYALSDDFESLNSIPESGMASFLEFYLENIDQISEASVFLSLATIIIKSNVLWLDEEEDEESTWTNRKRAASLLDSISLEPCFFEAIYPTVYTEVVPKLQSSNWQVCESALLIFGCIGNHTRADPTEKNIPPEIQKQFFRFISDPETRLEIRRLALWVSSRYLSLATRDPEDVTEYLEITFSLIHHPELSKYALNGLATLTATCLPIADCLKVLNAVIPLFSKEKIISPALLDAVSTVFTSQDNQFLPESKWLTSQNWSTARTWWAPKTGVLSEIPSEILSLIKQEFINSPEDNLIYFKDIITRMISNFPTNQDPYHEPFFDLLGVLLVAMGSTAKLFFEPVLDTVLELANGPIPDGLNMHMYLDCLASLVSCDPAIHPFLFNKSSNILQLIHSTCASGNDEILTSAFALAGDCAMLGLLPLSAVSLIQNVTDILNRQHEFKTKNNAIWFASEFLKWHFKSRFEDLPLPLASFEEHLKFFVIATNATRRSSIKETCEGALMTLYVICPKWLHRILPDYDPFSSKSKK